MIEINCQKRLSKNFNIDVKFEIKRGDFVCLYGKSGSGKTTLLRLLAGFYKPDSGTIKVGDKIFFDRKNFINAKDRNIGFLFQDYALFENMNVTKNLLFAKNDKNKADELLEFLELKEYANAEISALSGGQKQRVALARALMQNPEILLLDEPLSALDYQIRTKIQDYLIKIYETYQPTIILVSHDISEIYRLCNKVYEIENGSLSRIGSPREIFLKTSGSQKFSFIAKIVEIRKADIIEVAVVAIGHQLCEVAIENSQNFKVGDEICINAKAFDLSIKGNNDV